MPKRTKLFLDTEFTGLHQDTSLISIGIVSEDGRKFYAERADKRLNLDVDTAKFLSDNVFPQMSSLYANPERHHDTSLPINQVIADFHRIYDTCVLPEYYKPFQRIGDTHLQSALTNWLTGFGCNVEVWVDVGSWDWVLFCEIFGGARNLPGNVYYIPFDISTRMEMRGMDPDQSRHELLDKPADYPRHNALFDAMLLRELYEYLEAKG